jgi:hypothetical protein
VSLIVWSWTFLSIYIVVMLGFGWIGSRRVNAWSLLGGSRAGDRNTRNRA